MPNFANYAKALIGAMIAGLGVAFLAATDSEISLQEGIYIASVTLTSLASIWAVPNRKSA